MKKLFKPTALIAAILLITCAAKAQHDGPKKHVLSLWDGMVVAGYVNEGSYVNFGGPSIKFIKKPWSAGFGILPTMRIKKDNVNKGATRNSAITPTAGFGFTFGYRHLVMQVPFYYNSKTATSNGRWHPGIGVGFKF